MKLNAIKSKTMVVPRSQNIEPSVTSSLPEKFSGRVPSTRIFCSLDAKLTFVTFLIMVSILDIRDELEYI